jgi:hypothetical protein
MAKYDLISDVTEILGAVQTLSGTTPNNSALFDTRGYGSLTVALITGTVTDAGAAAGFTLKLQESDTTVAGDFTDVAAADILPAKSATATTISVTTDGANGIIAGALGYVGNKRYVRAVITGTAGTNATVQVKGLLGHPSSASRPVAAIGATTAAT